VLEGLRGEENISELCRREGIAASMYCDWSKEFLEAGKRRLAGDTARAATSGEVKDLRRETAALKGSRDRSDLGEPSAQKKDERRWGGRGMRYPASENAEIIQLVEQSHLPANRICRLNARWTSSASRARRSTAGMIATVREVLRP